MSSEKSCLEKSKVIEHVDHLPKDAVHIEEIRNYKPVGLYYSPSENQFYRKLVPINDNERYKKLIPKNKGIVYGIDANHKSIAITISKFQREWLKKHSIIQEDSSIPIEETSSKESLLLKISTIERQLSELKALAQEYKD